MLAADLRGAGYALGSTGDAWTLEVRIVKYEPENRVKRLFTPWGASHLVYEATVFDASGRVLGHTRGERRSTDFEVTDTSMFKSDRQIRVDLADYCAAQISEYVQALPATAPGAVSAAP